MSKHLIKNSTDRFSILLMSMAMISLILAGCEDSGSNIPEESESFISIAKAPNAVNSQIESYDMQVQRDLASLRRATAPYHNMEKAIGNNYDTPLTPCWYHSELGAMGYHYGNMEYLENGEVHLLQPEALMYEPNQSGKYKLVGLEYIVPESAWKDDGVPELMGQPYHLNETLGLYTLHIWLWKYNPDGLFSSWNPRVSCQYADESEDRAGL